jgi:hypothetical protein
MGRGIKREGFAVIAVLLLAATRMSAHAATITVTNTNDSGPGSLRQALAVAHDGDRITFAVSGAIALTSGGLGVTKNVTISGPGANQLAVDGNQGDLVFEVAPQRNVSISGLSIRNARFGISNNQGTVSVSNCVLSGHSFAGLYNDAGQDPGAGASMTVANSIISNNSGTGAFNLVPFPNGNGCACMTIRHSFVGNNAAGGISNAGSAFNGQASLTVINSNVSYNGGAGISMDATEGIADATIVSTMVSGNSAGGVFSAAGGLIGSAGVTIINSTISGNLSGDRGGGVLAGGFTSLSIMNSTISGNSAGTSGGGIYGSAYFGASIVNSTISGNSAGTGGGIYNVNYSLHVANSTISGNSADSGGGIYNQGQFEISNTILNAGASGENIVNNNGLFNSLGYNLSSDDGGGYLNGPADQINTDPLLGPLQDNGGPTLTHALLPGSPAIDKGTSNGLHVDQRHFRRPIDVPDIPNANGGDGSDIGAFEFGSFPLRGDFNGDGFTDYLLFNVGNRATAIWYLRDNTYISAGYGPTLATGWTVADVADFNGDGNPDYALFNASTRQTQIWYLNNNQWIYTKNGPTLPSGWQLVAVGDFDGDSKPDYVLYNPGTRQTAIWYLNDNVLVSGAYGPSIASAYVLSGVADFDGDGKPDYVLYNASTRQTAIWYLSNNVFLRGAWGPTLTAGWSLVAP